MEVATLFEQSNLLLPQAFNATSYFRKKSIPDTLIDGKSKSKEILNEMRFFHEMRFHIYLWLGN